MSQKSSRPFRIQYQVLVLRCDVPISSWDLILLLSFTITRGSVTCQLVTADSCGFLDPPFLPGSPCSSRALPHPTISTVHKSNLYSYWHSQKAQPPLKPHDKLPPPSLPTQCFGCFNDITRIYLVGSIKSNLLPSTLLLHQIRVFPCAKSSFDRKNAFSLTGAFGTLL